MEIQIVSREDVKPSSPTPHDKKRYNLSMIDQLNPPLLVPLILYFHNNNNYNTDKQILLLKSSLSLVLTRFYPLAGRISKDDNGQFIDCTDEGVPFVVANVKDHKLSDLLKKPDHNMPNLLVPCEVSITESWGPGHNAAMIQVNRFDCGGIAIAVVLWHGMCDGVTLATFMSAWADDARGANASSICPNYILPTLFPSKQDIEPVSWLKLLKTGKPVMKRYVFDVSAIQKLKEKIVGIERPTRVEVVTSLLWNCFMIASLSNQHSTSVVTHAVNMRRRARPLFPSECFGNFGGMGVAWCENQITHVLGHMVKATRDAIRKVDHNYVNMMLGDQGLLGYKENQKRLWSEVPPGSDLLCFGSWCGFGIYQLDFGWGTPIWVSRCDGPATDQTSFLNEVWLIDTMSGDGVEAWVTLDDSYMQVFDTIEELHAHASVVPGPLDLSTK